MSFTVSYNPKGNGESCDACNTNDQQPSITLEWRGREGRNIIFIHERCLERRVSRAKKAKEPVSESV